MTFTFPKLSALLLVTLASQCMETRTYPADGGVCGVVCPGARPHCDDTTMTCVACLENAHCGSSKPNCDTATHTCIACTTNAECVGNAAGSICDTGTGACRACANDGECAGNAGATVCRESTGRCVACTPDSEATTCGASSCSRTTFTCTGTARGSVATCYSCQADSECGVGNHCVPVLKQSTVLGHYCLQDQPGAGCGDDLANPLLLPYSVARSQTSVDGVSVTSCGLHDGISCEALVAFGHNCTLTSGTVAQDDTCGHPLMDDGYCLRPTNTGPGNCAYQCGSDNDCRSIQTCGTGSPSVCQ